MRYLFSSLTSDLKYSLVPRILITIANTDRAILIKNDLITSLMMNKTIVRISSGAVQYIIRQTDWSKALHSFILTCLLLVTCNWHLRQMGRARWPRRGWWRVTNGFQRLLRWPGQLLWGRLGEGPRDPLRHWNGLQFLRRCWMLASSPFM